MDVFKTLLLDTPDSVSAITGTLAVANGGTGVTASTGTTAVVLSNSPTIVTPVIATINDASSNETLVLQSLAAATDYIAIRNGKDTQDPPHIYSAGASTNVGLHIQPKGTGLVTISDGTVTDKQFRFSPAGSASSTSTILATSSTVSRTITLPDATDTLVGKATTDTLTNKTLTSPTLTTPILGTPSSGTLTSCTGLPISTGVSGLGTGVATALAVNVGSAGAPVVFNGALGTPSSGTVTNLTGTASININGTVGASTPSTGAFTTLSASGAFEGGNIIRTNGAAGTDKAASAAVDYNAGFHRAWCWGPDVSTLGQWKVRLVRSDGSAAVEPVVVSSTGLAVTGALSSTGAINASSAGVQALAGVAWAESAFNNNRGSYLVQSSTLNPGLNIVSTSGLPSQGVVSGSAARGSLTALTATESNDGLVLLMRSYGGSTWGNSARIDMLSLGTHTESSRPSFIGFSTTASGSTTVTERARISDTGLAVTGALSSTGALAIGNTVNTVSPTSPNRTVTIVIGGTTYYLAAKTTND